MEDGRADALCRISQPAAAFAQGACLYRLSGRINRQGALLGKLESDAAGKDDGDSSAKGQERREKVARPLSVGRRFESAPTYQSSQALARCRGEARRPT